MLSEEEAVVIHSINLEPDRDALDGRLLDKLIQRWLESCRARLPAATVDGYADKVHYFTSWWADVGPWHGWQLTESLLLDFVRWLQDTRTSRGARLSTNTQRDVSRRLRQALRWAAERGYTKHDFSGWVPLIEGAKRKRRAATLEDLRALLAAAGESASPERDQSVVAILIQTGIRRAECASILIETITMAADLSGTMTVVGKRTAANPTGVRTVAFDPVAGRHLSRWLDRLGRTAGPLFAGDRPDRPISLRTVDRIVQRAATAAHVAERVRGCHDLRRAWVTHWRRRYRGAGYDYLMRLQIGHASDAISDIYDLADEDDLLATVRGPLAW